MILNPVSANPTKWSNTLKHFVGNLPTNCLSVFDHFVRLALKGLRKYCAFNNLFFASFYPVVNSFINFLSLGWILTLIFSTNIYKIHNFFKTLYGNRIKLSFIISFIQILFSVFYILTIKFSSCS